jgi:hypothetical protein
MHSLTRARVSTSTFGNDFSMKHIRSFDMRLKPLAGSLALLLATGTLAAQAPSLNGSANAATRATKDLPSRYALRQQQRVLRAQRGALAATRESASTRGTGTTLPVTSCTDDLDDPGTLRNVLASAAEGDIVDLSALTCSTITLVNGPLDSSVLGEHALYDVTLQGPGRDALTIDADGASQVLVVGGFSSDRGTFTVNDLTIANGSYDGSLAGCIEGFGGTVALNRVSVTNCHASGHYDVVFGGAVDVTSLVMTDSSITNSSSTGTGAANTAEGAGAYVSDTAVLTGSTISGNVLAAPMADIGGGYHTVGGGLYVRGDLTLIDSTISGNSVEATVDGENAPGGGIYVRGITAISGSTIDSNSADGDGGGIFKAIFSVYGEPGGTNPQTKLTLVNSTVAGNTATRGGGIASSRPVYLSNSTIADNTADGGGGGILFLLTGVIDSAGILDTKSSIVANNTVGGAAAFAADLDGDDVVDVTGANNLIVDAGDVALPADTLNADPMLEPLQDNGGPTRTLALTQESPAIDTGNNEADLEFDQRGEGFPRVSGSNADIGAFEYQSTALDVIFANGFDGTP